MRLRFWRNPYDLDRALWLMKQADAYCAEHGHEWVKGDGRRYKWICTICGAAK